MDDLIDLTGDENFVRLEALAGVDVRLKLEYLNPAGSIKFKTAIGLIRSYETSGLRRENSILVESSSGNLGVALALICARKRYKFVCIVDPNTNQQNIRYMKALGSDVVCVSNKDANGGYLGSRLAFIRDLVAGDRRYVWANQYENPANPAIHDEMTATAIRRAVPNVTYLFVGAGTTGTLMGCVRHFARKAPRVRIVAVDSIGSVTFGRSPGPRHIPGLGASQQPVFFRRHSLHGLVAVPEVATIAACRYLAKSHGLLCGGSTGTVLAGIFAWRERFREDDVVVAIAPDGGERYLDTIYNDDWVRDRFGELALTATPNDEFTGECVAIPSGPVEAKDMQYA
jgi:cysteine synthase A